VTMSQRVPGWDTVTVTLSHHLRLWDTVTVTLSQLRSVNVFWISARCSVPDIYSTEPD